MSKNILITGGAGFIGFHLGQVLSERGDKVIGIDNFNDYYDPELKKARAAILKKMDIPVIEGDICDLDFLNRIIDENQITHVVHLAAQAGVRYSLENPHSYANTNLVGFVNILEACRQHPGVVLTYASSSSVYGLNEKVPFSVEDRVDHQVSLYGATKRSNELMAYTYHHLFKIPVTGLRFFTVYGPWGRPDMAYYHFTRDIVEENPIKVFNHGKLQRDFTYVDDVVKGTVAAIDLEAECELFNLGNHQPVALRDFIATIEESVGKKAIQEDYPMQKGDVFTTYADIEHSRAKLGYEPSTSLQDGIPKFVDWYTSYHKV